MKKKDWARGDVVSSRAEATAQRFLILSPQEFNALGTALAAPVSASVPRTRYPGFVVTSSVMRSKGEDEVYIDVSATAMIPATSRDTRYEGSIPIADTEDVLARLTTLIE